MADNQITPFQLTDQFTMDNFNQRINETNTALQNKADASHTHDDRYYTETEVNNLLSAKAPAYTYGTEDLTAGTSPLETGKLYFVYE